MAEHVGLMDSAEALATWTAATAVCFDVDRCVDVTGWIRARLATRLDVEGIGAAARGAALCDSERAGGRGLATTDGQRR